MIMFNNYCVFLVVVGFVLLLVVVLLCLGLLLCRLCWKGGLVFVKCLGVIF